MFLHNRVLLIFLVLTAVLLAASALVLYLNIDKLSYPVILHFNAFQGVDLVGNKADIWSIVAMGFAVVIMNTVLSRVLFYRERLMAYILLAANVILAFFAFISVAHIISLN